MGLAAGAPAVLATVLLVRVAPMPGVARTTVVLTVVVAWLWAAFALRERVVRSLQTLSNMLGALREGDYSIRARGADTGSALGLAVWEVNALADTLRRQRLDAVEAGALLRRVMESIDVAVFAFDADRRLRLVNRDGEQLLGVPSERAIGLGATLLGLAETLEGETPRLLSLELPGAKGRWELRRGEYRQDGRPHQLVFLSDLTRPLREEEREAWLKLIRVLSHEINNSLAPIQSLAGSLRTLVQRDERAAAGGDVREGLAVIESRAQSLGRFMHAYTQLMRLPSPKRRAVDVSAWVARVAGLETRIPVRVIEGPKISIDADGDQLDQLLINLVRNAADAALETGGGASVTWRVEGGELCVEVVDEGPGLADTENLFVPFFTTKPGGTGVGLALSRQIAEAHDGTLTLENRAGARGCVARVRLKR
jgi:two-component system nitrogen regulation sensor histidine kinase NtrY